MDRDLDSMSREELIAEAQKLRDGIRKHRDSTGQELCWHHPALWGLLPEKTDPVPVVTEWPQFMARCVRYRASLDTQAPTAPRSAESYKDMTSLYADNSVIFAAGGLLWRETPGGCEVLLVFRARYNDWTLPKGKFKPKDGGLIVTALREVKEETGYDVDISGFAGCTCYGQAGRPKVVLFWNMAPIGASEFKPSNEVENCEWFSIREAIGRLDHENEISLLRRFGQPVG